MTLTFLNLVVVSGILIGLISGSFIQFRDSYSGDVLITPTSGRDYIENSPALVAFLKGYPEVKAIAPRHGAMVQILGTLNDLPEQNERPNRSAIRLSGIDIAQEEEITRFSRFVQYGEMLKQDEEGYVLIGANMLKQYSSFADADIPGLDLLKDVGVGSRIRIILARKDGDPIVKEVTVKGIVKSKVDQISTRMFMVDRELARLLPANKEQLQEIAVKTDPAYAPELVAQLKRFMGSNEARIQTSAEAIPSFLRDIETTMGMLGNAISSIALVVASITIFIVIFINAITRRKFIGILKGIGVDSLAIEIAYVMQALFYALVGSALGALIVYGLLEPYLAKNPIDFPFSDGILVVPWDGTAIRTGVLLIATFLAGYIPSRLITRQNTLDAILNR
ncbi:MAG: hypothetical protein RL681_763 [Candidatus Parcubacteria bacterium]